MADKPQPAAAFAIVHEKLRRDLADFYWDAFTALALNGISGDYVEFGSDGATTVRLVHDIVRLLPQPRHIWAFDSFEGLPDTGEELDHHPAFASHVHQGGVARFHQLCADHGMTPDDYDAVVGYFDQTLAPEAGPLPDDIALAYVDCNLYSSTVTVLDFLAPRLKHGMIVAFDDYFCFTDSHVSGERLALHQFLTRHPEWHFERFKDPAWGAVSYVVERSDALAD